MRSFYVVLFDILVTYFGLSLAFAASPAMANESSNDLLHLLSAQAKLYSPEPKVLSSLNPNFLDMQSAADLLKLKLQKDAPKVGHQIVWNEKSSETVFIFIHGLYGSSGQFLQDAENLGRFGFNSILINLQGHAGFSDRQDKVKFDEWKDQAVAALKASRLLGKKAILIGQSTGGALALWLSRHFPEDIRAVVAIEPAVRLSENLNLVCPISLTTKDFCGILPISSAFGYSIENHCPLSTRMACQVSLMAPKLFQDVHRTKRQVGSPSKSTFYETKVSFDKKSLFLNPPVPTTIAYTESDEVVDNQVFEELAKRKNIQLKFIKIDRKENVSHGSTDTLIFSNPGFRMDLLKSARLDFSQYQLAQVSFVDQEPIEKLLQLMNYSWASEVLKPFLGRLAKQQSVSKDSFKRVAFEESQRSIELKLIFSGLGIIPSSFSQLDVTALAEKVANSKAPVALGLLKIAVFEIKTDLQIPPSVFQAVYWKTKNESAVFADQFMNLLQSAPYPYGFNAVDLGREIKLDLLSTIQNQDQFRDERTFRYLTNSPESFPEMALRIEKILITGDTHPLFWLSLLRSQRYDNLSGHAELAIFAKLGAPQEHFRRTATEYFIKKGARTKEFQVELIASRAQVDPWPCLGILKASWQYMDDSERQSYRQLLLKLSSGDKGLNLILANLIELFGDQKETLEIFDSWYSGGKGLVAQRAAFDNLHLRRGSRATANNELIAMADTRGSADQRLEALSSLANLEIPNEISAAQSALVVQSALNFFFDTKVPDVQKDEFIQRITAGAHWLFQSSARQIFCHPDSIRLMEQFKAENTLGSALRPGVSRLDVCGG